MKTLQQVDVKNKKILMRVDFNVPIENGKVKEEFRLKADTPTIDYLINEGASQIILISHLGRPEGKVVPKYSLMPVAESFQKIIGAKGGIKKTEIDSFPAFEISPKITLLENIRFYPEEEASDPVFVKKLAQLGDIFVFDAFGAAHRESASCTGLAKIMPSFAGFLLLLELEKLNHLLVDPPKPFVLILGGAKIADKLPVMKNLFGKVDTFMVGGAIANTFLASKEISVGKSLIEPELKSEAAIISNMILDDPKKDIFIPQDVVVSKDTSKAKELRDIARNEVKNDDYIVDLGMKTIEMIQPKIAEAGTIFWNGSLGICEVPEFAKGTKLVAEMAIKSKAEKILAGGDTILAVNSAGFLNKFDFVSTGGGAALEFLAGKRLPAVEMLE
ncbi:MAG TPA: phosphoglycerate kinase [Patescibacteria group bacterium]|nr:phosphoglycerate kinase [Patescibacteria group bacterium]